MNIPDQSFNKWKEEMRQDALEKELKRVKHFSTQQSKTIQQQRRTLLFLCLFIPVLILLLGFNGFLIWPEKNDPAPSLTTIPPHTDSTGINNQQITAQTEAELPGPQKTAPLKILKPNQDTLTISIPPDGILFSIQIGAYTDFDLSSFSPNLVWIQQDTYEGINQLSLGVFPEYPEAAAFLKVIKQIGFKDAFVMATRFGQRIKIQEALMSRQRHLQAPQEQRHQLSQLK